MTEAEKAKYEKEIDFITIRQGLGWQMFDRAYFIINISGAAEEYKDFKRKIYLTPEEIKGQIEIMDLYKNCR